MQELVEKYVEAICAIRKFPHKINVYFSDDINADILKYLQREKSINVFKNNDNSVYNAIALPYENKGFNIIVNNEKFHEITTIIHETTHIIDYYEFMVLFNNSRIDIENHKLYNAFCLYSEFNARFEAHKFYLSFLFDEKMDKDCEINVLHDDILTLFKSKENTETINDFYLLMQLLGRWYSIEEICNTMYDLPAYTDLYQKLKNHKTCESYENLNSLYEEFKKLSLFW